MSRTSVPRHLLALVGPTASGKTAAAVAVARRLPVEVISADSRQVRAEMRIGTAAPTDDELAAVPHHLVGIVPPDAPWSLAEFLAHARAALEDIWSREKLPLLVGGTGQYVWALLEGWSPPAVPPDPDLRRDLEAIAADHGPAPLVARLEALDPAAAARVDRQNPRRLIRAIEIALARADSIGDAATEGHLDTPAADEGEEGSRAASTPDAGPPPFAWHVVGLDWSREAIHARADARVEQMYAEGLIDETDDLLSRYPADLPAFQSIGYAEAARVLSGEWDLPTAIERTKFATHRLIRMQATWFRRDDPRIEWVDGADLEAVTRAVEGFTDSRVR